MYTKNSTVIIIVKSVCETRKSVQHVSGIITYTFTIHQNSVLTKLYNLTYRFRFFLHPALLVANAITDYRKYIQSICDHLRSEIYSEKSYFSRISSYPINMHYFENKIA
jgi:hypothetical protein